MVKTALEEAAHKLHEANSVVVTVHVQPDGDALGSLLAMARHLKNIEKTVCTTWGEEIRIPAHYKWMPGIDEIVDFKHCIDADVLLTLDCANEHRLGFMEKRLTRFSSIINIDHHIDNSKFGTINVLDFSASATCEIVYDLLRVMNADIGADISTLLYTGIVTDTGRFQYSNTTAKALRTAADLVDLGANPNAIFQNVYENLSFASLKLLGVILERSHYLEDSGLVYSYLSDNDFKQADAAMADTESFIDYLRIAREAKVAAIFKETSDGKLKVSLRSKGDIDVGAIAREGGGGGHRNAAGFTLALTIEDAVVWISERIKSQSTATAAS
ncbi:MAG: bifunctional oligoribonuclease/PAP phosphatase NrnA [Actinobacteria bacterium]|nr:bifunctional oligoribonuclease/PAP phosphatase NrnA [Actinomycetota bacterium]